MFLNSLAARIDQWKKPLLSFALGQPVVQFLNLLTGFFLLRWLDVKEFAMFGMAFAFQCMVTQLSDLGFSGSILALAGERAHEPAVIGGFLRSARHWRFKIQSGVLLLAAVTFPFIIWGQPWGAVTKILLFGSIVVGVVFQGWSMYGAPLLAHRALTAYYRPQVWAALLRLVLCAGFWCLGWLNAWVASLFAALALAYSGLFYRRSSTLYADEPVESEPEKNAAMLRYLAPLMPGVAFTALQGQIQMGLVAIFGSTQNIAEVSALGRLGQLFVLFGAFTTVFVQPYVARLPHSILFRRYLQIFFASVFVCSFVAFLGWMFPDLFLWLLGPNYAGLRNEMLVTLFAGCVGAVGGVLYVMHLARAWLFWWTPVVYILSLLIMQIVCISWMDLSHTLQVTWFGFITALVALANQMLLGVYGFLTKK